MARKIVIGSSETAQEEAKPEFRRVLVQCMVSTKMTDDELGQFAEEMGAEMAQHLLSDQFEKGMVVGWKDIRDLAPDEGYNLDAAFNASLNA